MELLCFFSQPISSGFTLTLVSGDDLMLLWLVGLWALFYIPCGVPRLHWCCLSCFHEGFLFLLLFFGCTYNVRKLPGQGSSPHHSSDSTEPLTLRPPGSSCCSILKSTVGPTLSYMFPPPPHYHQIPAIYSHPSIDILDLETSWPALTWQALILRLSPRHSLLLLPLRDALRRNPVVKFRNALLT